MIKNINWHCVGQAFSAVYGVGLAPLLVLPFVFSAMIDGLKISNAQAGTLITYELCAMCIGSLAVAPLIDRLSRRSVAGFGALLAILGNIVLVFVSEYNLILASLLTAGVGYGLALAAGNATVAASDQPERDYNHVVLLGTLLMVALLLLFPWIMSVWLHQGVFGGLAVVHLLMLLGIFKLPNDVPIEAKENTGSGSNVLFSLASIAVIGMVFFYFARDTMVWVYAERIGSVRLGLSSDTVSLLFGGHGALSLLGPIIVLVIAQRFGKLVPLMAGIVLTGLITITVNYTQNIPVYSAMVLIWSIGHFFTYSCMMGLASSIDESGRVVAAAGGAVLAGNAVAPAFAGYMVDLGGYSYLGIGLIVAVGFTAFCAWLAIRSAPVDALRKG